MIEEYDDGVSVALFQAIALLVLIFLCFDAIPEPFTCIALLIYRPKSYRLANLL